MKKIAITFDVEPDLHTHQYSSILKLPNLSKILKKYNCKGVFFVTCDCIEKYPEIFQTLKKQGHEIELHGYQHFRLDSMNAKQKKEMIKNSKRIFKKFLDMTPVGYRAPQHSIDKEGLKLLKENNFIYDSSITPWNFYHFLFFWKIKIKKKHNFLPLKPFFWEGILELPLSSFGLPFTSVTLRVLPKPLLKIYFFLIRKFINFPIFFMHSWDLIEIPTSKIYSLCPKDKFLKKFEFMLDYFSKTNCFFKLENFKEYNSKIK